MYTEVKYKGFWVKVERVTDSDTVNILVTDGTYYYRDVVTRSMIEAFDKDEILSIMKQMVDTGVKRLNKAIYPVTGRSV